MELVVDIATVLGAGEAVPLWRQAHARATGERAVAAAHVRTTVPPPATRFVGREEAVAALLAEPAGSVSLVSGMPGVGKSELAGEVARRSAERFGDGRLFVNLHGYDVEREPVPAGDLVTGLLRALGVQGSRLAGLDTATVTDRLRQELRGRRMVVVLDNAADPGQVAPLLDAAPLSRVLVTSRRDLALPGATHVALEPMTSDEALAMLVEVAGKDRVATDEESARRVADLCGFLPLHLSITAAHIAETPAWAWEDHVRRLEAIPREESVRPALEASYRWLDPAAARAFRLLSLHPGPSISDGAAAALVGEDAVTTRRLLRSLRDEHLVRQEAEDRHSFHDLVLLHAQSRVHRETPWREQEEARGRLLDHYVVTGCAAAPLLGAHDIYPLPDPEDAVAPAPSLADGEAAQAWLEAELPAVVAIATGSPPQGRGRAVATLANSIFPHLTLTGMLHESERLVAAGIAHADPDQLHPLSMGMARLCELRGDMGRALQWMLDASALPDDPDRARTLNQTGNAYFRMGRNDEAAGQYAEAIAVARASGDRLREGRSLGNLGNVRRLQGRFDEAVPLFVSASEHARESGDDENLAHVLANWSLLEVARGDLTRALTLLHESLAALVAAGAEAQAAEVRDRIAAIG